MTEPETYTAEFAAECEVLCVWLAQALAAQAFDRFSVQPIRSLIEAVRYLAVRDPDALSRVLERLRR